MQRPAVSVPLLAAVLLAPVLLGAAAAQAQTQGGTVRIHLREPPPTASIHEEATVSTVVPFMGLFNNLVVYDQGKPQNSLDDVVPDLADSWSWSADRTQLTFKLHPGVKWHDGKPFTAADVKCTWDMLTEKSAQKLRKNPRLSWYFNLDHVSVEGDAQATFHLKRPQPSFLAFLASGFSPVYPCHVPPAQMRTKPVGTGPFKLTEFRQNEVVKVVRNPDYWKPGRPHLDGIDFVVIKNRSTAKLAFISGDLDVTFPAEMTPPLVKDILAEAPKSVCDVVSTNVTPDVLINWEAPPFDKPEARMALMLALDRKAFIDVIAQGEGQIGGTMLPGPDGVWGMPAEMLKDVPGYDGDVKANREKARALMQKLGYGPDKRIALKIGVRNEPGRRDPAVLLIDQLKDIYMDAELDLVETTNWYARVARKEYTIGMNQTGRALDDPDQNFYENFACNTERNYTKYCNPELQKAFDEQSQEADPEKRKRMVWEIDRKLQEDVARPVVFHSKGGTCRKPAVKGLTVMVNSIYNGWRFEDLWLEK